MRNLETSPEKDYGSSESIDCPTCGTGITAIVTRGPGVHNAAPCGHRVSDAYLTDQKRVATDGGLDPCPACGEDPERCYRCQQCGHDLAGRSSTAGREAMQR